MMRLTRKPSLWVGVFLRVIFVLVALAALGVVQRRYYMIALAAVIACGAIVDLIYFAVKMRHRTPLVEIDHQPLAYGDSAQLRVVDAHLQCVKLIGECSTVAATDISEYCERKFARTRCYEEELFRGSSDTPVTMQLQLPKSPPADAMRWTLVVDSTRKHGAVIEHPFPLRVRNSA